MAENSDRRPGWLELFYDLLFVVLVAQLAHPLTDGPGWDAGLRLLVLFLPAWWMWVGSTLYTNLTGEASAGRRLDVLAQMGILLVMAGAAAQAADGRPALFAGAYVVSRLEVVAFRLISTRRWPAGGAQWPLLVSAVLWIASVPVHAPWSYGMWLAGLAVEIVPSLWHGRRDLIDVGHLVERFGQFVIIVLGAGIEQIVTAVARAQTTLSAVATGLAGFAVLAVLWWVYFEFGSAMAEQTISARRGEAYRLARSIFVAGHFLPVVSLLALAAGLGALVTAAADGRHAGDALRLCTVALAVHLTNNAAIGRLAMRMPLRSMLRWLLPNVALLVALNLTADRLAPVVPLLLTAAGLSLEALLATGPRSPREARALPE
ncbi:low temperature requirement protein A [Actinoplanes sp. TBRC 11911]|uniref:low temperature requirement protein A n=1 Tax=Actinoplanes sp. TBRC 11911 TaxID=2729386 RepID=UPI00145D51D8|nr:low temperature requirement protein A [Actinoplanes sp. TBRC 11911]NMO57862.1 low temperature requirement protein A [Actinoplanes sp. TBRC 11911]